MHRCKCIYIFIHIHWLLHPDKCAHKEATSAFQRLQQAIECLSDVNKRRTYDVQRSLHELVQRRHDQARRQREADRLISRQQF